MSATGAGAVNIRLGAITTDFLNAMKGVSGAVRNSVASMNNDLASFYKAQDRQRAVFSKGLGRLADDFQSVGRSLTVGLTGPLAIGLGMIARNYASITQLKNAGEAYGITLQDIQKIAKAPGLGLEEAAGSVVGLRAVQYDANLAKSAVMEFGNALTLAGKGKAELQGVSLAFQQIKSKGSIQAEEINQIAERMPQIRQIMKDVFGTTDTQSLQKLGISADEFTTKVVTGLSKLPRAIVGPQVAWENFTDGLKIGSYEIGASADRLFGLTDKLSGLGDVLGDWAGKFKALPDSVQKAIFLVTGLATALGPLTLAIGSLIRLLPVVKIGFAALGGPVALTVTAVAGAAMFIMANWDKLKVYWEAAQKTFTDSGVWSTFTGLVSSAFDLVTGVFKAGVALMMTAWNTFKGFLIPQAKFLFGTLTEIFNVAGGVLTGIFKVLTGILTLDWSKLMEGLQNITVSIWNGIIGLTSKSIAYVGELFAAFVEQFGARDFGASIRAGLNDITSAADTMKVAVAGAKKEAQATSGMAPPDPIAGTAPLAPTVQDFARTPKPGKGEKTELEKELDDVERRIKQFQDQYRGIEPPAFLRAHREELKGWLGMKQEDRLFETPDKIGRQSDAYWKTVTNGWKLSMTRHALSAQENIATVVSNLQGAVKDAFQKAQDQKAAEGGDTNIDSAIRKFSAMADFQKAMNGLVNDSGLGKNTTEVLSSLGLDQVKEALKNGILTTDETARIAESFTNVVGVFKEGFASIKETVAVGLFEALGESIASKGDAFGNLLKGIVGMLAEYVKKIGAGLIKVGSLLLLDPLTAATGVKKIITGGIMIAGASAVNALASSGGAKAFANGGIVRGATLGLVGEYPSARTGNPEVISPLRTLKSMLSPLISQTIDDRLRKNLPSRPYNNLTPAAYTQRILVEGEFRAQGSELLTVLRRAEKSKINFG
ncbi:tape measure protein [Larkinella humicola]|uniref:Tape measure protein n=1 Tax=Larkinella humicola TaxID=2607654 RepID=A0A5N1JL76_9BACT|nr:tape measure protein [Larkinella humicola]KAA9357240.1 tape measure protein [Larkinella humicola]